MCTPLRTGTAIKHSDTWDRQVCYNRQQSRDSKCEMFNKKLLQGGNQGWLVYFVGHKATDNKKSRKQKGNAFLLDLLSVVVLCAAIL